MTREEMRTRILDGLNDPSGRFVSSAQVSQVLEEAQDILSEELQAIKRTVYVPLKAGVGWYALHGLGDDVMTPWRIWTPTQNRRLIATTMQRLDAYDEVWLSTSGDPEYWYPLSWDWFGVYPKAASGGGTLRVDYLAWPQALLDDADEPEFPVRDHDSLVLYGIYDGLLKRWDFENAMILWSLFVQAMGQGQGRTASRALSRTFQQNQSSGVSMARHLGDRFGNH